MNIKYVFSDFDGTLTNKKGFLSPTFFKILDLLKKNKIEFIPVSGRSISWGHFLLTHFEISRCIMEGGGVLLEKMGKEHIDETYMVDARELERLEKFSRMIMDKFPKIKLTNDSLGRSSDRAIDLECLKQSNNENEIINLMKEEKINFSKSNVHFNFWCGDISKANASLFLIKKMDAIKIEECLFFGDAPNDESMFKAFPYTVGVSNISDSLKLIKSRPQIILEGDENYGVDGVYTYLESVFAAKK